MCTVALTVLGRLYSYVTLVLHQDFLLEKPSLLDFASVQQIILFAVKTRK